MKHIYILLKKFTRSLMLYNPDLMESKKKKLLQKSMTDIMLAILDYADRNLVLLVRSNLSDIEKTICEALTDAKISPESLR